MRLLISLGITSNLKFVTVSYWLWYGVTYCPKVALLLALLLRVAMLHLGAGKAAEWGLAEQPHSPKTLPAVASRAAPAALARWSVELAR